MRDFDHFTSSMKLEPTKDGVKQVAKCGTKGLTKLTLCCAFTYSIHVPWAET
jgi:hypothetical protein